MLKTWDPVAVKGPLCRLIRQSRENRQLGPFGRSRFLFENHAEGVNLGAQRYAMNAEDFGCFREVAASLCSTRSKSKRSVSACHSA